MKTRTINVREEDAGLYDDFAAWFHDHGERAVHPGLLSPCGVLVESDDGMQLAVGWLYLACNVGVAWLEFVVTNPGIAPMQSARALRVLFEAAEEVAKELNYSVLLTMTEKAALGSFIEARGFSVNHQNVTQFIKRI